MSFLYLQAFALRQKYGRDPDGLARHLAGVYIHNPALVDEVFSGMEASAASSVREQLNSSLSSGARLRLSTATLLWPPKTHSSIVRTAFDDLDDAAVELIQHGSEITDWESLTIPTLKESNAPQHAMTPAAKVKELKSVEKAQEWARGEAKKFVAGKLANAKDFYGRATEGPKQGYVYWRDKAYTSFGEATHTMMDNWSPAHRDFQVFDGNDTLKSAAVGAAAGSVLGPIGTLGGAAVGVYMGNREHSKIEERKPTDDEMNSMIDEMRLAYQETFGNALYNAAVSEVSRTKTSTRLGKRGSTGMLMR